MAGLLDIATALQNIARQLGLLVTQIGSLSFGPSASIPIDYINNTSGTPIMVTLPSNHSSITIKDAGGNSASYNIVVVDPHGALIDQATSFVIAQDWGSFTFIWNSTQWYIF